MAGKNWGKEGEGPQTIYRLAPKSRGYTKLATDMLQDKKLSLETRGFLADTLSRPQNWVFSRKSIQSLYGIGETVARRILKESKEAGYIQLRRERRADGTLGPALYYASDCPEELEKLLEDAGLGTAPKEPGDHAGEITQQVDVGAGDGHAGETTQQAETDETAHAGENHQVDDPHGGKTTGGLIHDVANATHTKNRKIKNKDSYKSPHSPPDRRPRSTRRDWGERVREICEDLVEGDERLRHGIEHFVKPLALATGKNSKISPLGVFESLARHCAPYPLKTLDSALRSLKSKWKVFPFHVDCVNAIDASHDRTFLSRDSDDPEVVAAVKAWDAHWQQTSPAYFKMQKDARVLKVPFTFPPEIADGASPDEASAPARRAKRVENDRGSS